MRVPASGGETKKRRNGLGWDRKTNAKGVTAMKIATVLGLVVMLAGCGGWGGNKFTSDKFGFKVTFPEHWELWDKSNDEVDFVEASIPDRVPTARIVVRAVKVAPDLSPNEIYPSFMDGSEFAGRTEFTIEDKGTIACKNSEGRFIKYMWRDEERRMRGMKAMFLGTRMLFQVWMEMPADDFINYEGDFTKMIRLIEL